MLPVWIESSDEANSGGGTMLFHSVRVRLQHPRRKVELTMTTAFLCLFGFNFDQLSFSNPDFYL